LTIINMRVDLSDFWDTAGQEIFQSMHASYYYQAHACILVFDATRKVTYKNLANWYQEMRQHRPEIPCVCAVNKIDSEY
jgi:Rab-like protein 2